MKLSQEDRRRISKLEIVTRRLVDEFVAGQYSSLFRGRGVEFSEVREYLPGDDVRSIDWNVTARFGHPFVKKNVEERELTMIMMVDVSASLDFGSGERSKRDLVSELAALLALSALNHDHKVGLLLYSDRVELFLPPRKGRRHILRLIREILNYRAQGTGTDLQGAVHYLNRVQNRRAVVFLMSDFLGEQFGGCLESLRAGDDSSLRSNPLHSALRVTCRHHDVSVMCVQDPREKELPDVGRVRLRDLETGEVTVLNTSLPGVRREFARQAQERLEGMRGYFDRTGADYGEFSTSDQAVHALVRFLQAKKTRSRKAVR